MSTEPDDQAARLGSLPLFQRRATQPAPSNNWPNSALETTATVPASYVRNLVTEEEPHASSTAPGTTPWLDPLEREGDTRARADLHSDRIRTGSGVDWALVRALRQQAADRLASALRDRESLDDAGRRALGSSIILGLLTDHAAQAMATGAEVLSTPAQQQVADAVFDALFGLGRLQPLVDDPQIENVEIFGCDGVFLEFSDGRIVEGPPVADTDDELIDTLAFVASRSQTSERPFSPAHPELHLRLDDGSRLAAWAWTTPRPAAVIRRHRLRQVSLRDLVEHRSLSSDLAGFLAAAVRAKRSIVVSGPQGAGKTTLLRALCACLDPWERVGTIETEHELHLFELTDQHRRVIAWEARPGSGERGADGRPAGEVSVADITYGSWRANLSRLIVGEVRGHEVLSMFEAMQGGAGSMSTTHANSGRAAVERLVTLSVKSGAPVEFAYRQVAEHVDLIVHVDLVVSDHRGAASKRRYVSEVVAVAPGENGRPAYTDVFIPGPDGDAVPGTLPEELRVLQRFGLNVAMFDGRSSDQRIGIGDGINGESYESPSFPREGWH